MTDKHVEWFWKSNDDPFSDTETPEWNRYSDIENILIEEAFQMKKPIVIFDDYHLDLEHRVQISNENKNKQRSIKRVEMNKEDRRLREARFMPNPIVPTSSFHDLVGLRKIFIDTFMEKFHIKIANDWDKQKDYIVDKAMSGILYEGQLIGKQTEAKWINQQLEKVKNKSQKEISECCVYLYSLESFLYKILNQTMRLIGDKDHENIWKNRLETLGPFAFLLFYYLSFENVHSRTSKTVYRGAQLTDEIIAEYRRVAKSNDPRRSFQAFTSCSRNRTKAEQFGNVLFILEAQHRTSYRTLNMDISSLSAYPDEEEVLIRPGRTFKIESVEYDANKNKHLIHLTAIWTSDSN